MSDLVKKLLPCPFCGCRYIDLWPMKSRDGKRYKSPVCKKCGATINENYGTKETTKDMVAAWNRRAPVQKYEAKAKVGEWQCECGFACRYEDEADAHHAMTGHLITRPAMDKKGEDNMQSIMAENGHPNEGPCVVCGQIFDTHEAGCIFDKLALSAPVSDGLRKAVKVSIGKDDDGYFVDIDGLAAIWLGEHGPTVMAALDSALAGTEATQW